MIKPTYILGISAYFHDSAAALIKDGELIVAIQEERLSRVKQDNRLPVKSVEFCLEQAGIGIDDVNLVAYYEKPFRKFERLLENQVQQYPFAFLQFRKTIKEWLKEKLWVPNNIKNELGYKGEFFFCDHHQSHAAAACYNSPFEVAAFLTLDGVGEWTCGSFGEFQDNKIKLLFEQKYPHSVGMLYSAFTQYCGFRVNSGEYKLMGLAPYGEPKYLDLIREQLIEIHDNGSIQLNLKYFHFHRGMKMINHRFEALFGQKMRNPDSELSSFYQDIAASIQKVVEEIVIKSARHIKTVTGKNNLCFGGGVALNCKANQVLLESNIFEDVYIYPSSGDAGGAIGAAMLAHNKGQSRTTLKASPYLGKEFQDSEIESVLKSFSVQYEKLEEKELIEKCAELLKEDRVIAWHQGRDEIGPRALGNRSILASPIKAEMKEIINKKIKFRESFRPFAPMVLEEKAEEYFKGIRNAESMLFTYTCLQPDLIPACVHLDDSSRAQTVGEMDNPKVHKLLSIFEAKTGVPVLINTSLNRRGEPMVHSPEDTLRTFVHSGIDTMVIGNYLVTEKENINIKDLKYDLD